MALTETERDVGRVFRADCKSFLDELNANNRPNYSAPNFLGLFRHLCSARNNKSTAIELHEYYITSPIYPDAGVPAGRFGFIYREGRCRGCGHSARSEIGRLVDAHHRPPLTGRVKELAHDQRRQE